MTVLQVAGKPPCSATPPVDEYITGQNYFGSWVKGRLDAKCLRSSLAEEPYPRWSVSKLSAMVIWIWDLISCWCMTVLKSLIQGNHMVVF